jgi:hypothetical protein
MAVPVKTAGRFTAGKPEKLFHLPASAATYYRIPYTVSSDSRRFLIAVPEASMAGRVVVVTNWMESLGK